MTEAKKLTRKDFTSDQEVRWCPGCGDYAILATVQGLLPELGAEPENTVFVSGIGCAARFPYYMDTYGFHSIHGRAPAIATGLAGARPDLDVWVVTGDGDALSIGGNHLIHALRRNVNITIMLFNNEIYGLTKGQYSPTSRIGQLTKSSPMGAIDTPFNPISVALGAEATFVARTLDNDRNHLQEVLTAAHEHRGAAFVEIFQNCIVFNDDAFIDVRDRATGSQHRIELTHGEEIVFGPEDDRKAVVARAGGGVEVVPIDEADGRIIVHDAHDDDSSRAFALSRLSRGASESTPFGIFRQVKRPVYQDLLEEQIAEARERQGAGDLRGLIESGNVWEVS
jgi:2-oxoglutarate/2-oxoacid ferredoxin oxidoreductase subunit beta